MYHLCVFFKRSIVLFAWISSAKWPKVRSHVISGQIPCGNLPG
jgi:hypothetical protein